MLIVKNATDQRERDRRGTAATASAPSSDAASYSSAGIVCRPDR